MEFLNPNPKSQILKDDAVKVLLSVQFSSAAQSCPTLCDPMNRSTPGLPVHYQLPEFTQTHVNRVGDAIQPSHPLLSPSLPALNLSQHQDLFKSVSSSHQMAKVLEFQLFFKKKSCRIRWVKTYLEHCLAQWQTPCKCELLLSLLP